MNSKRWLTLLLILGAALRFGFWFIAQPRAFPDTGTYVELAQQLVNGDLSAYEGRRTLGYPLLLILAQLSPDLVWVIQMLAGLAISACLFYIAYEVTGSPGFGCFVGMTYHLNLGQLFFEANLIPETETILFVSSTTACIALINRRFKNQAPTGVILVVAGMLAGSAVFARPQFVFLPILLGIITVYGSLTVARSRTGVALARGCLSAGPGIIMILAWSCFNFFQVGHFTLSTQTGIGLMEHTIAFIELAPERDRTVRDVLLKHRDFHLAQTGRHTATWDAIPELKTVTGLQLPALDRELLKLSIRLIVDHPFRYAALVGDAWISFWLVSNPKGLEEVKPAELTLLLARIWRVEHSLLRLINIIFLVFVTMAVFSGRFRHRTRWGFILTSMTAIVLVSSGLQALVIGVDNTRYGVTVQALVVLIVMTAGYQSLRMRLSSQRGLSLSRQSELSNGGVI